MCPWATVAEIKSLPPTKIILHDCFRPVPILSAGMGMWSWPERPGAFSCLVNKWVGRDRGYRTMTGPHNTSQESRLSAVGSMLHSVMGCSRLLSP